VELACRTAPPLDPIVFHRFCVLLKDAGRMGIGKFREQDGKLFISGAVWSPHLRDTLDSLLTSAETSTAHARQAKAEQQRLEHHKRERAIETAAKALGIPVK
jgi:hypothetical protein